MAVAAAFLKRDLSQALSYRLSFLMQLGGIFFSVACVFCHRCWGISTYDFHLVSESFYVRARVFEYVALLMYGTRSWSICFVRIWMVVGYGPVQHSKAQFSSTQLSASLDV